MTWQLLMVVINDRHKVILEALQQQALKQLHFYHTGVEKKPKILAQEFV